MNQLQKTVLTRVKGIPSGTESSSAEKRIPLAYRLFLSILLPVAGLAGSLIVAILRRTNGTEGSPGPEDFPFVGLAVGLGFTAFAILFAFSVGMNLLHTLRRLTDQLARAGDEVGKHSDRLSNAGYRLSSGATQAASSLEETASSIEELSSMVKLTAEHAREASELSASSRNSAEQGERRIHGLISSMQTMQQQSKRIEDITTLIDDVAFQTNLLALNAAVEAARAGEHGKGFAVVADAVRSLALKSAQAAKDIGTLVRETVESIESGSKMASDSEIVLREIVSNVRKVADLNDRIAAANQEQANGIEQITQAVNQLDAATQVNAASAEQAASSANDLAEQAESLEDLVSRLSLLAGGSSESGESRRSETAAPAPRMEKQMHLKPERPMQTETVRSATQKEPARKPLAVTPSPSRQSKLELNKAAPTKSTSAATRHGKLTDAAPKKAATAKPTAAAKPAPAASANTTAEALLPLPGDPAPSCRPSETTPATPEGRNRDERVIPLDAFRAASQPAGGDADEGEDEVVSPLGRRKVNKDSRAKRFSNMSGF